MGGAIGFGNLLRFPSQVFNNNGIQWFIPYFLALALLAIPVLILEVALGSSLRGGSVLAYNGVDKRARGAGLGNLWVTLLVVLYYVPMLSWVMRFFRGSFESPLPWEGRLQESYDVDVLGRVDAVPSLAEALATNTYMTYPGTSIIGEQVGWNVFSWFVVWMCIYGGTRITGKVVYITMDLPIIIVLVLIVRISSTQLSQRLGFIEDPMAQAQGDLLAAEWDVAEVDEGPADQYPSPPATQRLGSQHNASPEPEDEFEEITHADIAELKDPAFQHEQHVRNMAKYIVPPYPIPP
ncbi:Putative sodium:neurotransmitter symporter [Septoria linicola]|uniref:Sodium:neurotransmitter symporter n=1 Tax=Septoria linicola TaxID=215465 RepID=A0A9Q9B409_9PEZI|nr:putative sodium:neurotransmitter symporter [Septoria linicola]USW57103.1 Putative sodium:neurotransmitter symporter [Septoria linicola]